MNKNLSTTCSFIRINGDRLCVCVCNWIWMKNSAVFHIFCAMWNVSIDDQRRNKSKSNSAVGCLLLRNSTAHVWTGVRQWKCSVGYVVATHTPQSIEWLNLLRIGGFFQSIFSKLLSYYHWICRAFDLFITVFRTKKKLLRKREWRCQRWRGVHFWSIVISVLCK